MNVKITSSFTNESWEGVLDEGDLGYPEGDVNAYLEAIFRFFQRVVSEDHERLLLIDYELPSLSAGDRIELNGRAYKVGPVSFTPDTREPDEPLRPWPLGGD